MSSPPPTTETGLPASCQCGYITFHTPRRDPSALFHCHCTECRKQSASAYGTSAVYPASPLFPLSSRLSDRLSYIDRPCDSGNSKRCYFCPKCGVRVFHRSKFPDGTEKGTITVKAGVVEGLDWKGGVHIWVGSAVVDVSRDGEWWEGQPGEKKK